VLQAGWPRVRFSMGPLGFFTDLTFLVLGSTQPLAEMSPAGVSPGRERWPVATLPSTCVVCLEILEASTSWSPKGLSSPAQGLLYCSVTHPSVTLLLIVTALIRVSLQHCTMSHGDYTLMPGVVDRAQLVFLSHAPVTDAQYRLDDFGQHNLPRIHVQLHLQTPMLKSMSQCSSCALCVFNRPKAALFHRDKLTLPRSVLAHLNVTPSRKLNFAEQCCTMQHFGLTLTRIRAMKSLCADLFSLCSGL
jgi:hypothetical protein